MDTELVKSTFNDNISLFTNLNLIASTLYHELGDISWSGFYITNPSQKHLDLYVFVGRVACLRIPFNKGVVGHSFRNDMVLVVDDVDEFESHIACDSNS